MSLDSTQMETTVSDAPVSIPMDADGVFLLGTVEAGRRLIPDRAVAIVIETPVVSNGTFSIGTNAPDYDDIMAPIPWNLLGLGGQQSRDYPLLAGGHTIKTISPGTQVFVSVKRGLLDEGGKSRLVLFGFSYPGA